MSEWGLDNSGHEGGRHFCHILLVVAEADVVAGSSEGIPGDVEPGGASEELVGQGVVLEEVDETLELSRVFGTDVSGLADKVLGIANAPYPAIDGLITKARIDDDRANDQSCWFQQLMTAISQIRHDLHRGNVLRIFFQIQKLVQKKVRRQANTIEFACFILILFHGIVF